MSANFSDKIWYDGSRVEEEEFEGSESYLRTGPMKSIGLTVKPLKWTESGKTIISGPYRLEAENGKWQAYYFDKTIGEPQPKMLALALCDSHNEKYVLAQIDLASWKRG